MDRQKYQKHGVEISSTRKPLYPVFQDQGRFDSLEMAQIVGDQCCRGRERVRRDHHVHFPDVLAGADDLVANFGVAIGILPAGKR
jgi:hypothetical protein